jgi:hypothetical protein
MASGSQVCSRNCADEEQQAGAGQRMRLVEMHAEEVQDHFTGFTAAFRRSEGRSIGEDRVEVDRAEQHEDGGNTEHEAEVADAVDDEGLYCSRRCRGLLVPEADQQI